MTSAPHKSTQPKPLNITILGAGAWGTALACIFAQKGKCVTLVPRRPEHALALQKDGANTAYLPGIALPPSLTISTELGAALAQTDVVLIGSPAKGLESWAQRIQALEGLKEKTWIVSLSKGLEPESRVRPGVFWQKRFPKNPYASLSGPNNAREVALGQPAAAVLASEAPGVEAVQNSLHTQNFRIYRCTDVAGVEWGGCLKNVYAIAMGISNGLGFGDNARAALLTRAMTELVRLGKALGGQDATFYGLSGLGDFTATAFGGWSRNRNFGEAIGSGKPLESMTQGSAAVVEGYASVALFWEIAQKQQLEAPILEELFQILYKGAPPRDCAQNLLLRGLKSEA